MIEQNFIKHNKDLKNQKEWWLTRERKPVWGSLRSGDSREGNGTMENSPEGMNGTSYRARKAWTMEDLERKTKERESNRDNEKWKGKNRKQILLKIGNGGKTAINAPRKTALSGDARRRETVFTRIAGMIQYRKDTCRKRLNYCMSAHTRERVLELLVL